MLSRILQESDLPALNELVVAAHWNQTAEDWRRMLALCGPQAIGIEVDGRVVASATLIEYGAEVAWLGMVLTRPEYRGRGFAKHLLQQLLAPSRREQTIYLDATTEGEPLYAKFGFVAESVVRRWQGTPSGTSPTAPSGSCRADLDRRAFGADRESCLRQLCAASQVFSVADGSFACYRPGRLRSHLGPVVATTVESAEQVVRRALSKAEAVCWDIPDNNAAAQQLAESLGFQPVRRLVRMRRGAPLDACVEMQFGLAGFEYG